MSDMHDLQLWDNQADYLIYDDIPFSPTFMKGMWGGQGQLTMTDKFKKKFTVVWGKPFIFICNPEDDPFEMKDGRGEWVLAGSRRDWYTENCVKVVIEAKLY